MREPEPLVIRIIGGRGGARSLMAGFEPGAHHPQPCPQAAATGSEAPAKRSSIESVGVKSELGVKARIPITSIPLIAAADRPLMTTLVAGVQKTQKRIKLDSSVRILLSRRMPSFNVAALFCWRQGGISQRAIKS